ncbi:unnamed protein product [Haemonchus placei]|uniref:Conserved oligomeric Golgi complex subunit 7 n=1 Tax=Haemonchus placei TaxID=6290 RepID=A0A0N4W2U9_HAEPC|nr:unnamed protein product [Haemonchus placei]
MQYFWIENFSFYFSRFSNFYLFRYLRHVVEEWSDSCLLNELTSSSGRAVFEESSAMFKHVWNQMAEDVVTSLRLQTIDAMKPYQQHFWCFMEPRLGSSSRDLTALFCPVLMKIRTTFAKTGVQISKVFLPQFLFLTDDVTIHINIFHNQLLTHAC